MPLQKRDKPICILKGNVDQSIFRQIHDQPALQPDDLVLNIPGTSYLPLLMKNIHI
jgi:hypothetical protein